MRLRLKLASAFADHHCRIHTLSIDNVKRTHCVCVWAMFGIRLIWERSEVYNVCRQIESISSVWFMGLLRKIILNIHSVPMCIYLCIIQYHKCIRSEHRQFTAKQCCCALAISTVMLQLFSRHYTNIGPIDIYRCACDSVSINYIKRAEQQLSDWKCITTGNKWMQLSMPEFRIFKLFSRYCLRRFCQLKYHADSKFFFEFAPRSADEKMLVVIL